MNIQTLYQNAIRFAAAKHGASEQVIKDSNLPYVVHLSNVAMEVMVASHYTSDFDIGYAIPISLLHDTLEDTHTDFEEIEALFGLEVAEGVQALTKNASLPKQEQIADSLRRIKELPMEIWAIKMADRITNLQEPPQAWDLNKRAKYLQEAKLIHQELKEGNKYLAQRLALKIEEYPKYIEAIPSL